MDEIELIVVALNDWLKKLDLLEKKQPELLTLKQRIDMHLLKIDSVETPLINQIQYITKIWDELLNLLISNYDKRKIIKCILKLHGYIDENIITEILLHL